MRLRARLRAVPAAIVVVAASLATTAAPVSAHPLGNFTANRAIAIRVADRIEITAILDLAEIPAYEIIRQLDTDDDDAVSPEEGATYADETCAQWRDAISIEVDGETTSLEDRAGPLLTFPAGAGGLPTLRLECRYSAPAPATGRMHELMLTDRTTDARAGWREVSAIAADGAEIESSDVPETSPSALLTAYPDDALAAPPDVRAARVSLRLADGGAATEPAGTQSGPAARGTADDPLAALVGGSLSPGVVLLAIVMSLALGAAHALSPGHGKTLVAAYVLGAGGSARSALQIGLWVAVAHTAGVFVLGIVTLVASRYLLPERLIDWLSLISGVIVTGLGLVLLLRLARRRRAAAHGHDHGHDHGHLHPHPHAHPHDAGGDSPPELTWRGAVALGFAGGAVPSASALIVLLVALATDRLAFGVLLIVCFGIGMAAVLGGLALAVARVRSFAADRSRWPMRAVTERLARLGPVAAGLVVLATGLAFTAAAASRLT